MEQTNKYIKALNWGYGDFSPMTISPDFAESMQQVLGRLSLLEGLDYDVLLDEALEKGKEYLERYTKTDDTFEYGLRFMRDGKILLKAIPTMFKCFKDGADKFRADGLWTDDQWRTYRNTLDQIADCFEDRLKQFASAYDFNISGEVKPTAKRNRGRPTEPFASKMIDDANGDKLEKMHTISKGKRGKDFALIILACIKRGWCYKPTYTQVKEEFGDIGSSTGYNRYLNNINMYTQEEIDGALKSLD